MTDTTANRAFATTLMGNGTTRDAVLFAALAVAGTAIMAISAKINVPFYPVPQTLQTLAVFGIAAAYGRNLAVATMLLYLAQGFAGLPVFAGPVAGPAYLMGPTAGYLVGFVLSAAIVGEAADRGWSRSIWAILPAMLLGNVVVFGLGFAWLATIVGASAALTGGVVPFILGGLVKIVLAAAIVAALWKVAPAKR